MSNIGSGTGFNRLFNGSQGMQVNRMLDKTLVQLGYPPEVADKIGDLVGARIDAQKGDIQGMMRNLADLNSGMSTAQMDRTFGKGSLGGGMSPGSNMGAMAPFGFCARPLDFLAQRGIGSVIGSAIGGGLVGGIPGAIAGGVGAMIGGAIRDSVIGRGFSPFGGISREAPFGTGREGRSIERACRQNPFFKAQMERQLGGKIIADCRNDGKLSVWRPPFSQVGGILKNVIAGGALAAGGLCGAIAGIGVPLSGAMMANRMAGSILGHMQQLEGNIANFAKGFSPRAATDASYIRDGMRGDPQLETFAKGMGIDLKNASFEDIIALLLMKYAKNKETDVMKKVKELDKSIQKGEKDKLNGGAGGGEGGGIGGMVGSLLGGGGGGFNLGGILSAVGGVAGNMLLPGVGGMLGSAAGGALGGALSSAGRGGASGAGGGMEGTEMGQQMNPEDMSDTMKQQALQKLMSDLQKTYEMLSNMMKSMHDMQMTPIRALRG